MKGFLGTLLLLISLSVLSSLLWFKKSSFFEEEANRYLNKYCKADKNWNSRGRVYAKGLAILKEIGKSNKAKIKFVKQTKLYDIGLID